MMNRSVIWFCILLGVLFLGSLSGCSKEQDWLFQPLDTRSTGIDFVNTITRDDSLYNSYDFFYVFNGGGVGVGDVNNDGLPDLYFSGNMVGNRLYLNRGDFQFEDVTQEANVEAAGVWSTGVTMVDINQDGLLDMYVCVGGPDPEAERVNLLYVNQGLNEQGIPEFTEEAGQYGIGDPNYSTHAAFFDYDLDGDLDLYVLDTAMRTQYGRRDRLYRNNSVELTRAEEGGVAGMLPFTDVSEAAGIWFEGFGLGLAISDINQDGWPDIYAANDFISKDLMYINNGDGTFTDKSGQHIKHQSYSAMGVDIADFNNDALLDIMVLDMLPPDPVRRRLITHEGGRHRGELEYGRNTLQLNRGKLPQGSMAFSEIGQLAGVDATDWSWAPLFADFDNDGDRDLFISNGYGEFVTHLDFEKLKNRRNFSGTPEQHREEIFTMMRGLPELRLPNFFFENDGDLTFENQTDIWSPGTPGLSNGAALVDLDQDGDLDLVTNNIDDYPSILRNTTREKEGGHSLRVMLKGPAGNSAGLGAKLFLFQGDGLQYHDHSPYRGFQSTIESIVHFGLGSSTSVDSLIVYWPDGVSQTLTLLEVGETIEVHHAEADKKVALADILAALDAENDQEYTLIADFTGKNGLAYDHIEFGVIEYDRTPLLPHKFSLLGPGIAVGDADGNGLDDVFVGSDRGRDRRLFLQSEPGRFEEQKQSWDNRHEDMGSLFFDADGDGDHDLYVVSGGNLARAGSEVYRDRLYLNDGTGTLIMDAEALPEVTASGSSVIAADYDVDGDLDLFVGGRLLPGSYPLPPRSYLLRNDSKPGQVRFTDVTEQDAPGLARVGLVTSALWTDFDNDDQVDLVVTGEWMAVRFFKNEDGQFSDVTDAAGMQNTTGWWSSLVAGDFDRDGDTDYIAGNLGLNSRYRTSQDHPVRMYAKDFDNDGRIDPIITQYHQGTAYITHSRDEMNRQIVGMLRRFPTYQAYGEAPFSKMFTAQELEGAYSAEVDIYESSYIENSGDGTFTIRPLPVEVQVAPIFGMRPGFFDGDEYLDVLMVGNWYAPATETGRVDAFYGALMSGNGSGEFSLVDFTESGFVVPGDAKGLAEVAIGSNRSLILATQNNGPMKAFESRSQNVRTIPMRPDDRYAMVGFQGGELQKIEGFFGSTYLSQSSRFFSIPVDASEITIINADGDPRVVEMD